MADVQKRAFSLTCFEVAFYIINIILYNLHFRNEKWIVRLPVLCRLDLLETSKKRDFSESLGILRALVSAKNALWTPSMFLCLSVASSLGGRQPELQMSLLGNRQPTDSDLTDTFLDILSKCRK